MDVFSAEENLTLDFINNSNEILAETMLAGPFLHQWLESLEEQYDFAPVHISLPSLPGEKTFSSDSKTADYFERLACQKINPADNPESIYEILELPQPLEPGFVAVHQKCAQNPLLPVFARHVPFYLKVIHRLESLSTRLKLARLSLDLQNTARELNDSGDMPEENALSLVETFLNSSRKDHAFVYYPEHERFLFPDSTAAIFHKHQSLLNTALKNAIYERSIFKNEEFHPDIKGLILYPMFSRDDLFAIFGCFSNTNPIINDFDVSCVCNFCTNIANITNLANLVNPINPINQVNPINPINPINQVNPINPINQANPIDPINQVNPINPINQANPIDPINQANPINPINQANPIDPINQAKK